jgi:ATP-dependent DNA helicase RecQ
VWGYRQFRPMQEDIISSVLSGKDTLALLPTGGGKSVCFQVPALAVEGICIVVSPLIALMKDQVEQLKRRHINAIAIYSGMSKREIDIALDNCVFGQVKFLYVSPERLKTDIFRERLKRMKVGLLAVDEAHCISQWGYDFRPPYLEIAEIRELIPEVPVIALTATATDVVKLDIQEKLLFKQGQVFQKSFARANLSYSCFHEEDKERKMLDILTKVPGTAIVYVRSRKRTKEISEFLRKNRIRADYYHAGLPNEIRAQKQDDWIKNKTRVIVATNAFGMGIDKPDVRVVIHMDLPDNPEAYYQEAGRAGRDEKKAYAVVLYNDSDLSDLELRLEQSYPAIELMRRVYQSLANYLKIAVGSSQLASYDFDIEDFQKKYDLPAITTYHALKKLELEGFLQLNESFYSPSKVMFTVDNKRLYEFQVANYALDPLIKVLLRMYGGEMFINYIQISERSTARNMQRSELDIIQMLLRLQELDIISYDKQKDKPQVTFMTERYDAARLPINVQQLEERKKIDQAKLKAMTAYVQHLFRCRTALLLEYFGEIAEADCGVCDNCLKKKKNGILQEKPGLYRTKILDALASGSVAAEVLARTVNPTKEQEVLQAIRVMLDANEIQYDEAGKLKTSTN